MSETERDTILDHFDPKDADPAAQDVAKHLESFAKSLADKLPKNSDREVALRKLRDVKLHAEKAAIRGASDKAAADQRAAQTKDSKEPARSFTSPPEPRSK